MAHRLVVVDLISQADLVERHVAGWPAEDIVRWLRTFGRVDAIERLPGAYWFTSAVGLEAVFRVQSDGTLWIGPRHH